MLFKVNNFSFSIDLFTYIYWSFAALEYFQNNLITLLTKYIEVNYKSFKVIYIKRILNGEQPRTYIKIIPFE